MKINSGPIDFFVASIVSLAALVHAQSGSYIQYSTVTGYFLQDEPSTNATTFDYVRPYFCYFSETATDNGRLRPILVSLTGLTLLILVAMAAES